MTRQLDMFSNPGDTSVGTGLGDLDDDRHGVTSSTVPQVDDERATSCSAEAPQPSAFSASLPRRGSPQSVTESAPSTTGSEWRYNSLPANAPFLGDDGQVLPNASGERDVSLACPSSPNPYDVNRPAYTGGETFDDLVRFVRGVDKLRKHGFVTADVETIEREDGWYMRLKTRKDMEVKL